jgi:hypothetical protein
MYMKTKSNEETAYGVKMTNSINPFSGKFVLAKSQANSVPSSADIASVPTATKTELRSSWYVEG